MAKAKRMYGQHTSEDLGNNERRCVFCGKVKSIYDFPRNGYDADGNIAYRKDCTVCYNIRRQENKSKKVHSDFLGGMKRRGESEPKLSHQEWKEIMIFFAGECAYCGCTPKRQQRLTKDHLEPVSQGGATTQSNIVPACANCNSSKGADEFKNWFMKQSFFSQERLNRIFRWRTIMRQIGGDKSDLY